MPWSIYKHNAPGVVLVPRGASDIQDVLNRLQDLQAVVKGCLYEQQSLSDLWPLMPCKAQQRHPLTLFAASKMLLTLAHLKERERNILIKCLLLKMKKIEHYKFNRCSKYIFFPIISPYLILMFFFLWMKRKIAQNSVWPPMVDRRQFLFSQITFWKRKGCTIFCPICGKCQ